ncbi:MAG: hypothetical protein HYV93_17465 [Candidatus Rokubacteria bacterium]|nr:hypothetical protein [Candidatus Rokubacteria bacterium]
MLISRWRNWGGDRVLFEDGGRVRSLPTAWTSIANPDPFVAVSAGRSFFRIHDLLALVDLIGRLSQAPGRCKGDSAGSVRGTMPAAPAASEPRSGHEDRT